MGRERWTRKKTKEIGNTTANHHAARLIDPRRLPKRIAKLKISSSQVTSSRRDSTACDPTWCT